MIGIKGKDRTNSVAPADLSLLEAGQLPALAGFGVQPFAVGLVGEVAKLAQGDLVHEFDYVVHAFDGGVEALSPAVDGVLAR